MASKDKDIPDARVTAPAPAETAAKPPRPRISKEHRDMWARLDAGGTPKK